MSRGVFFTALLISGLHGPATQAPPEYRAEAWPAADRLFRSDARWLGADGAYSVALGKGRSLWLFAHTFVAREPGGKRAGSTMIRNCIGIQSGDDPSTATLRFHWPVVAGVARSTFSDVAEADGVWLWPGHGVRLGDALLLFFMRVRSNGNPGMWGFEAFDWTARLVENPDEDPPSWRIRRLVTPRSEHGILVGSAGVLVFEEFVYAFSVGEPDHRATLARWPIKDAAQGDLSSPQWWSGSASGWVAQSRLPGSPAPVFEGAQTEFTVHKDARLGKFVEVQTDGFGGANVSMRTADRLEGPWSSLSKVYRPPEADRRDVFVYQAKAHPQLAGADLVLTYSTNGADFGKTVNDTTLYFPRFVKLALERR